MTWWMVISGAIGLLLFLMALGMPLFAAFLVMNVTGVLVLFGPAGFGLFANSTTCPFSTGTSTTTGRCAMSPPPCSRPDTSN